MFLGVQVAIPTSVVLSVVSNRDKSFYYLYSLFNRDDKVEATTEHKLRRGILKLYSPNPFLSVYTTLLCALKMLDIIIAILLDKSLMSFMSRYFSSEIVLTHLLKDF